MKKHFLIAIIGLLFVGTTLTTSCKKDKETDPTPVVDARDQYIGTWNVKQVGSLTLYQNGNSLLTLPIDTAFTVDISKSGDKDLKIKDRIYHVNGKKITADPENITKTESGMSIVATVNSTGTLGSNMITINDSITGTWNSAVANGNLSGTTTSTLTK